MRGIRRTATGWQVFVKRGGQFKSKRFPHDTPLPELEKARLRLEDGRPATKDAPALGRFAKDAADYLALVTHMPSYSDRAYHIQQWADAFRNSARSLITKRDILAVLEGWRVKDGLSPGSLNRRRTALMHLYTTLDGKSAPNIVKDVPRYDESESDQPRAFPMLLCSQIIRHVPIRHSKRATRTILHALQWTGWPGSLIKRLTADDLDTERCRVRVPARKKGKGMRSEWVPVMPRAMTYLQRVVQLKNYQGFSNSSINKGLEEGRRRYEARLLELWNQLPRKGRPVFTPVPHVRPYDLKHSFGTWAAGIVKDDAALKALLRTNSIERYTQAARAGRMEQARDRLRRR